MLQPQSLHQNGLLLLMASVIGFASASHAWLTPLTGVTGTIGALGVIISSALLALLTFLLRGASSRGARITLIILTLAVLLGTGFAGMLLHQYIITAAMVIGLLGLITLNKNSARHKHRVRA